MNIEKVIQSAFVQHQRGDLKQAKYLYEKILKRQPDNIDVLHMLGVIYSEHGNYELAIKYIKKALKLNSNNYHAYYNLGNAFRLNGQSDEAIDSYRKVIQINPYFADAYQNLGIVLESRGEVDEAIGCFQKVVHLNPNFCNAYVNLANIHRNKGQIDEAMIFYQKVIELNPNIADAYCYLGLILQSKGQLDEAMALYQKAIELNPNIADTHNNLGSIFENKGQLDQAIACYERAIESNPNMAVSFNNMATALQRKGHLDKAMTFYQKALHLEPNNALIHFNISLILLLSGDFREGWKEYEWRWKTKDFCPRNFHQPLWSGSDITGRTILLYTEQGFGDAIQFIRYAPLVAGQGAKVIVECQKELTSLFKNVKGIDQIITRGEQLPSFDVHCPLLSLPLKFNTTMDTIPAEIPYIKVNTALFQKWKDKVQGDNSKFRVGLVWAGNPRFKDARMKACSLKTFSALSQFEVITFYSLQKGDTADQAQNPPEGMRLADYTDDIHDFSDTAALIENLDLVISVDTAVAHLAGAMGRPVWTLLPFAPDWRWLLNREDSRWYPTMRLFRQPSPGDWQSVIHKVAEELRSFIDGKSSEISIQDKGVTSYSVHENSIKHATSANEGEMEKITDDEDFYQTGEDVFRQKETAAIILNCEGMGDCLFALAVIRKLNVLHGQNHEFVIFTHRPELFKKCPYVEEAYHIDDTNKIKRYQKRIVLFDLSQMPHWLVDTYDFISIPAGIGELSFREKQLEYFPVEEDRSVHYDVVINTSETWPSRSWPIQNWQKVADFILAQGYSIAVVGKDTFSKADNMWKRSKGLKGCADLTNKLSLDQTYFTINNCSLFITCQNGLSVLSGATNTEVIVLDMSIEWSKRAIYRNEDPHYKATYVKGNCQLYCCSSFDCPTYGEFRCIPTVEQVLDVVKEKLKLIKKQ